MKKNQTILLTGCTGSGKSTLAIELAKLSDSIIINADSMQVYKCLKILTSRPTDSQILEYEHALYGHIDCQNNYNYNAGTWLSEIKKVLSYSKTNNLRPIIVGGTGLYFSLLINGLSNIPKISLKVKNAAAEIKKSDPHKFFLDLKHFDPEILTIIDSKNLVRLQRAWEVYFETGKSIRFWQKEFSQQPLIDLSNVKPIVLSCETELLKTRIDTRFNKMKELGVIEEVKTFIQQSKMFSGEQLVKRAIGFVEIEKYLSGEMTLKDAEKFITLKTRQYAKKQRTWFRNQLKGWETVAYGKNNNFKDLADRITNSLNL